jgi:general secretion pathway protein A
MYVPFFGLSREPFSIAPDPRFLFMSERHREALAHLLYGVRGGGGFVLLTGEIGAGKTTVGRCFLEQLPGHCAVAYIFNPKLSVVELLQTVCAEFGLPVAPGEASIKSHVDALNRFLLEAHAQGRQALLVIDEAQSLSAEVLEQLRLLTNLETAERKLLQIILIGQPELRDMLAQPGLEQLAQRVIARYHLGPLSREESAQYVAHRLAVAGPDGRTGGAALFDSPALSALHRLAAGVPRRINLLADRALLGAYAQGKRRVDRRTVVRAAAEVFADTRRTRASAGPAWPAAAWWAVALLGLCLVMLGTWAFQQRLLVGQGGWGGPDAVPGAASVPARAASWPVAATPPVPEMAASLPLAGSMPVLAASASVAPAAPGAAASVLPPPASPPSALAEPADVLASAHAEEGTAWRELALHWQVAVGHGEPCALVVQAQLACLRQPKGGVPALRRSNRPAVLTLVGPTGHLFYAVLVALDDERATLQAGSRHWVLSLPALATIWRGDSATLWRTPPGWREGGDAVSQDRIRDWVAQHLPPPGAGTSPTLRDRVAAFQVMQGLPSDGRAGPLTLMQLNRHAGVEEPRLPTVAPR